jgi:hypothetical protein
MTFVLSSHLSRRVSLSDALRALTVNARDPVTVAIIGKRIPGGNA